MPRIEHFALFCDDLESLRAFYTEALGLRIVADNSQAPVRGYFLADDRGVMLEIIARPAGTPAPPTRFACHAAFWVDDYAKRRPTSKPEARFEADTEIVKPEFQTGFFDDPQGNRVQIVWRAQPLC